MAFSSRQWAEIISHIASRIYFSIIIFQIPLFRFPCGNGVCQSPTEVTAHQVMASGAYPETIVKVLLYPRAIINSFIEGTSIPSHDQLLTNYKSNMREACASSVLRHLEVVAGSYLCVVGALFGLVQQGRMCLFGLFLIVWGITRQDFPRKHASDFTEAPCIYPAMVFAMVVSFFSMKRDVRKLIRSCKPNRSAKEPKNCSKTK